VGNLGDLSRRIKALFSDTPFNFGWVERDIAVSGRPVTQSQVRWLHENGIRSILSLTEDRIPPIFLEGLDIVYEHIPIPDHEPPLIETIVKSITFIDRMRREGRPILIHCAAGQGRSGSIAAAYMMYSKGLNSKEAIDWIRSARPGSIDPVQEESLRAFEAYLRAEKKRAR